MEENKIVYTNELQSILAYMLDVLSTEFPTDVFTPEFLITSILDNKKSHANAILDNCLMTHNIKQLKLIYVNFLRDNYQNKNKLHTNKKDIKFNDDLKNIMDNAEHEKNFLNSEKVGSEHVLLSMLNPSNKIEKIQEVFNSMGVDYDFLVNKCAERSKERNSANNKKISLQPNMTQLKSEINTKAMSSKTQYISQYTINLNSQCEEGKIDDLIGREKELEMITKVLARRKKNNVIIVGKGGVGKTLIVQNLAKTIVNGTCPNILKDKQIVQLNIMAMISGTQLRGMFEERVKGLFDELKSNKNYILFLDDIQQVLRSTGKDRDTDISQMIGDVLADGEVRVIGTTTFKDYRNSIESNTSLVRKFQKIVIEPSSVEESIKILEANKHYYENYHNVKYSSEVIKKTVELSQRYITDRCLPDSAIDVIDLTGAYTCLINREPQDILDIKHRLTQLDKIKVDLLNHGDFEKVDELSNEENELKRIVSDFKREMETNTEKYCIEITQENIATSISDITNIPINKLSLDEKKQVANIDKVLKESVVGQDEAINGVSKIIKRNKVGLGNKNKPLGVILLVGSSGVGKSLIAKKLAEEIYGSEKDLIRIDMSEYSEKNSVSKLTGSAPGYIGFENGGQLTEQIKHKQHCVLLLDEIEKADQEVYNVFLQLFDEGRLTDSSGQLVNFKNVIVLMTSNVGAKEASELGKGMGFVNNEDANKKSIIEKSLKSKFTPEFLNRIDKIVYFNSLTDDNLKDIVKLEIEKLNKRLHEIDFSLTCNDDVVNFIHSEAVKQKNMGARPIIRLIQDYIEDEITNLMLSNEYEKNYEFNVTMENETVKIV